MKLSDKKLQQLVDKRDAAKQLLREITPMWDLLEKEYKRWEHIRCRAMVAFHTADERIADATKVRKVSIGEARQDSILMKALGDPAKAKRIIEALEEELKKEGGK